MKLFLRISYKFFYIKRFLNLFFLISLFSPAYGNAQDANKILKLADEIRNPSQSFVMQVKVKDPEAESLLDVYLKGTDKTLIIVKEPAKDRGRNMLMLDRDFHSYVPNLKRSVRLSLSQKLSGQVANGDIARTRWYGDYKATITKTTKEGYELHLRAAKENLTYEQMRLWLKKNSEPIKAEYLSLNGDTILKRAYFENYRKIEGRLRPGQIRIEDLEGNTSYIQIVSMKKKQFDDSFFTVRKMETFK